MDDESYFKLYGHQDNKYFYEHPNGTCDAIKYIRKEKFEPKLMVWMAISPRAASPLVIFPTKQNINGEFYREFILRQVVKPFVDCHYPDGNYLFWPDLAPGHTASETVDLLHELDINFIEEDFNPPNSPQLRPIERFWSHLKRRVYMNGWEADNLKQLQKRIEKTVETFPPSYFVKLMKNVNKRIFQAARVGVNNVK